MEAEDENAHSLVTMIGFMLVVASRLLLLTAIDYGCEMRTVLASADKKSIRWRCCDSWAVCHLLRGPVRS
jgi:hypothetical protein